VPVSTNTIHDEPGHPKDARASKRTLTVLRTVKVQRSQEEGLATLQNISDDGMKLALQLSVRVGDAIVIFLSDVDRLQGTVVWTDGAHCGLQLVEPIDSNALLADLVERTRDGLVRPVRMATTVAGIAYSEGAVHPIQVRDISQRGIKIEHCASFVAGRPIKVRLITGLELSGTVRWSREGVAGIRLLAPIGVEQLGSSKLL
jgi:hypothetical protein